MGSASRCTSPSGEELCHSSASSGNVEGRGQVVLPWRLMVTRGGKGCGSSRRSSRRTTRSSSLWLANRLSSRQDGEEIATAAFQIAWERYQKGGALDTRWLYGVVRNLVGTEYRKRDRQERLRKRLSEDLDTQLTDLAEPELYSDIRDAVERLPPQYREVIMMTYWEDLTAVEISETLEIEATGVRTRLMRARKLLRITLTEMTEPTDKEVNTRE